MKRTLLSLSCAAAMLLGAIPAVFADNMKNTITVSGTGTVQVKPDTAVVSIAVVTRNASVSAAVEENADLMLRVQSAIQTLGIAKADFSTSGYSIYQETNYRDGKTEYGLYRVSNNLDITVRDIDAAGAVIDTAVSAGANQLNSVSFSATDTEQAVADAQRLAMQQAADNASVLSAAAGRKLGKAVTIQMTGYVQPRYELAADNMVMTAKAATPIKPGTQNISASVTVIYELR